MAQKKNLADLLKEQASRLNGFVYCTWPFSCGLTEAMVHAKHYEYPKHAKIDQVGNEIVISIPPRKGSGKRKTVKIKLWV